MIKGSRAGQRELREGQPEDPIEICDEPDDEPDLLPSNVFKEREMEDMGEVDNGDSSQIDLPDAVCQFYVTYSRARSVGKTREDSEESESDEEDEEDGDETTKNASGEI